MGMLRLQMLLAASRLPFSSRIEGPICVSMTWRTTSAAPCPKLLVYSVRVLRPVANCTSYSTWSVPPTTMCVCAGLRLPQLMGRSDRLAKHQGLTLVHLSA